MKRLSCFAFAIVAAIASTLATGQAFPGKPIHIVVPSAPGDGSDLMARAIGQKLTEAWGQPVIVDNRPGAGGRIGSEVAAKAAPDGYTWIMANAGSHGINAAVYQNLPFDVEKDFAPITQIMRSPNVLIVSPSLKVNTVQEFIALLKKNPGKYSYGSGGNGTSAHMSAELFKMMAGVDITHVPYKGATPALTDLIAGQIAMFLGNLPPAIPFIKNGQVKALAVTSLKRSPELPNVPTLDESGLKGFETIAWFGLLAPAGTPKEIIDKVRNEVVRIVAMPDIRERIAALGGEPVANRPEEFAAIIHGDVAKWKKVAAVAHVKVD
ncbi:MAG TPA: tripartite tricarboxylate transporter substrate binding protein [Casimicrobiaceae bacterium]|nr:tripartite tricarboxylate transporter substrate binding protein [Casimicrobiaceae bacterium]